MNYGADLTKTQALQHLEYFKKKRTIARNDLRNNPGDRTDLIINTICKHSESIGGLKSVVNRRWPGTV